MYIPGRTFDCKVFENTTTGTEEKVKRTGLRKPVFVTGRSFAGFETITRLIPTSERGIYLKTPSGKVIPINQALLTLDRLLHNLKLRSEGASFWTSEHLLGFLYATGLDGILIDTDNFRLAYDARAKVFWDETRHALKHTGDVRYVTPPHKIRIDQSRGRYIELYPDTGSRVLEVEIHVAYPELGEMTLTTVVGDRSTFDELFSSRPLGGRTLAHVAAFKIASLFGWPHKDNWHWSFPEDESAKKQLLRDLCFHRLLDLLGALMTVCPPGARVAGRIVTDRAGHAADMQLTSRMKAVGWRS